MPPTPDALATTMNKKEAGETPLSQTLLKGIFVLFPQNCTTLIVISKSPVLQKLHIIN